MEKLSQSLLFFSLRFVFVWEFNQEVDELHDLGVVLSRFAVAELYSTFDNEIVLAAFESVNISNEVEQP